MKNSKNDTQQNAFCGENKIVQSPPLKRFQASLVMDFDKWHDGIGYDMGALRELSADERRQVEAEFLGRGVRDWRDIEVLAFLDTPATRHALRLAMNNADPDIRNAVTRYAPDLVSDKAKTESLIAALQSAKIYEGLSGTLLQVEDYHPPEIIEALLRGVLCREGEVACHYAAMLYFLHGKSTSSFDWEQRPFFLRFNTEDRAEREVAFRELCERIDVNPAKWLSA